MGESGGVEAEITVQTLAQDAADLLAHLNITEVDVLGFSFGVSFIPHQITGSPLILGRCDCTPGITPQDYSAGHLPSRCVRRGAALSKHSGLCHAKTNARQDRFQRAFSR